MIFTNTILHSSRNRSGVLIALCLLLYLPGFFSLPPFDRDEARFAQASRQMIESGDFITIHFQDQARLKKPVGIYWLQSASARVFGASEIWSYRVPSLIGAVIAVLGTAALGCLLFGPNIGFAGAAMLAGCVLLGVEARLAKTDAVLLAALVIAQLALARIWLARTTGWAAPVLFWLATGIGILIKGPIAPLFSAFTIAGLCLYDRRTDWLKHLRPLTGLAIVTALVLPWLIAIMIKTGGTFFSESIGHDLIDKVTSGQESKGFPPGFYLFTFQASFFPFALPALLAIPWTWANRRDPAVYFCLVWIVPAWILFEIVPTKLPHYILPCFPAIALLTARAAEDRSRPGLFCGAVGLAGAAALVLIGGGVALPPLLDGHILMLPLILTLPMLGCFGAGLILLRRSRPPAAFVAALAGSVLLSVVSYQLVLPQLEQLWLNRLIAARVAEHRPCPHTTVASAGYAEPGLVFLLGTRTRLGGGNDAARHLQNDPECGLSLVQNTEEPLFRAQLNGLTVLPLATVEGVNYSNGKRQRFTLYRAKR
ncbi:MAG: glycosyltransferase family 39 protein [Rhodospirillaceae bacterium]